VKKEKNHKQNQKAGRKKKKKRKLEEIQFTFGENYARIRHPSPFLLTLPTPPKPSRTTSHNPVLHTISLISSAVSVSP
jgi:hypothetical protein